MNKTKEVRSRGYDFSSTTSLGPGPDIALSIIFIILLIESLSVVLRILPRKELHTGTNVLLLGQACATLICSASAVAKFSMDLARIDSTLHVSKLLNGLVNYGGLLQLANAFLLSLERLISMKYPLYHHRHLTTRNVLIIMILLWILMTLFILISIAISNRSVDDVTMKTHCYYLFTLLEQKLWKNILVIALVACLIFSIFYIYIYIMVLLKRKLQILAQCTPHEDNLRSGSSNDTPRTEPQSQRGNSTAGNFASSERMLRKNIRLTAICIIPASLYILSFLPVLSLMILCAARFPICETPQAILFAFPPLILTTINIAVHCHRLNTFQSILAPLKRLTLCGHRVHDVSEHDSRIATVAGSAYHLPQGETPRQGTSMGMQEYRNSSHLRSSPTYPSTSTLI